MLQIVVGQGVSQPASWNLARCCTHIQFVIQVQVHVHLVGKRRQSKQPSHMLDGAEERHLMTTAKVQQRCACVQGISHALPSDTDWMGICRHCQARLVGSVVVDRGPAPLLHRQVRCISCVHQIAFCDHFVLELGHAVRRELAWQVT